MPFSKNILFSIHCFTYTLLLKTSLNGLIYILTLVKAFATQHVASDVMFFGSHWSRIGPGETAPSALVNGGSWF